MNPEDKRNLEKCTNSFENKSKVDTLEICGEIRKGKAAVEFTEFLRQRTVEDVNRFRRKYDMKEYADFEEMRRDTKMLMGDGDFDSKRK
jgi:hypothetical protein